MVFAAAKLEAEKLGHIQAIIHNIAQQRAADTHVHCTEACSSELHLIDTCPGRCCAPQYLCPATLKREDSIKVPALTAMADVEDSPAARMTFLHATPAPGCKAKVQARVPHMRQSELRGWLRPTAACQAAPPAWSTFYISKRASCRGKAPRGKSKILRRCFRAGHRMLQLRHFCIPSCRSEPHAAIEEQLEATQWWPMTAPATKMVAAGN